MKIISQQWAKDANGRTLFQMKAAVGFDCRYSIVECLFPEDDSMRAEVETTAYELLRESFRMGPGVEA